MHAPYCLPLIKHSTAEVQAAIGAHNAKYRYFEVWLDYLEDADETFVKRLGERLGERLIVVFRRQNLEPIQLASAKRLALLELLTGSPAMVDVDLSQTAELAYLADQDAGLNVILSHHDYRRTPDSVQLRSIIATMETYRPRVYKLATFCESPEDALRLLELLRELKAHNRPSIVLGMGEFGAVTRVFGSLWGNEMVFAPLDGATATAPGQLTRAQLAATFKALGE